MAHERFLVFAACLSLLSELAERRPVLCLVDDAHWLDAASADALRFVARRLDAEGIALIFAAREGDVRAFEADDVASLTLSGLDADAADVLLSRGAVRVGPEVRERLVARTRGNALALVELPSVLTESQLAGAEPLPEALPMTQQLETVFYERVGQAAGGGGSLPAGRRCRRHAGHRRGDACSAGARRRPARARVRRRRRGSSSSTALGSSSGIRLSARRSTAPLPRASAAMRTAPSPPRLPAMASATIAAPGIWRRLPSSMTSTSSARSTMQPRVRRNERRTLPPREPWSGPPNFRPMAWVEARGSSRAARNLSLAGRDEQAVVRANQASPLVRDPILRAELARVHGLAAIRSGRPAGCRCGARGRRARGRAARAG